MGISAIVRPQGGQHNEEKLQENEEKKERRVIGSGGAPRGWEGFK